MHAFAYGLREGHELSHLPMSGTKDPGRIQGLSHLTHLQAIQSFLRLVPETTPLTRRRRWGREAGCRGVG